MHDFSRKELYKLAWEKPIMAQIELTRNCNQSCIFCFSGHSEKKVYKNLTCNEWLTIFQKLHNLGIRRLDLTGSENFLYPGLMFLLKRAKEMGFGIRMDTNGTFDISKALPFVDEFAFSVHGLGKIHEQITRKADSFSSLKKNIAETLSKGIKVQINMTLVKINYHQILQVFEYFSTYSQNFSFSPFMAIPSKFGNKFNEHMLEISKELISDYMEKLRVVPADRLILKHGFHSIFIGDMSYYISLGLLLPNCAGGKYKMVVDYDGSVFPCNFFKGKKFYCGNLLTEDAKEIWENGKGFLPFRSLVFEEKIPDECKGCVKKSRCFSGCRAWTKKYQEGGFDYDKDFRCELGSAHIRGGDYK